MHVRSPFLILSSLLVAACQEGAAVCESGSVERDGQCVPAALAVRMTHLDVRYDLSQPVHVNNRVPITFGLTAEGVDGADPVTRSVAVMFSFVEADPADPADPIACSSSAINVEVTGDGAEQLVDGFIWPTTLCAELAATGRPVSLEVEFDGGAEVAAEIGSDLDAPGVVFSAAHAGDELNQLCRSAPDGEGEPGCVHTIDLRPTPAGDGETLIDVRYALSAASSVAVVPRPPAADAGPDGPADREPSLVVQSRLVVNGRDPYRSAVDPTLIPSALVEAVPEISDDLEFGLDAAGLAALAALPGRASISYTIQAASDAATRLPLTIRDAADPANRVAEAVVERVLPGTANDVVHELFLEDAALAAVSPDGAWADESEFLVRGCLAAEFPQSGNRGDEQIDDCQEIAVVLVHEGPAASGASSLSFDKAFERKLGGDRIAIESTMSTQNRLDLDGVSSHVEGAVTLRGKLGKSYELTLARAFGTANLGVDPTRNSYEVGVDAFNNRIYSHEQDGAKIVNSEDFSVAKSVTVGNLGFGFGPVTIGFKIGVGGTIGFEAEDTLEALTDDATCRELLQTDDSVVACGRLTRVSTPNFGLTGSIEGGIDLKIVKAGVAADLRFVTTRFPLDTTLGFGLTDDDRLLVRGGATWDMEFQPLAGDVSIVGRVGFRRFAKTLKVNLFSFSSPVITTRLLSLSMPASEVLQ